MRVVFLRLLRSRLFVALNTIDVLSSGGAACLFCSFKQIFFIGFNFIVLQQGHITGRSHGAFIVFEFYFYKQAAPDGATLLFFLFFLDFFQKLNCYYFSVFCVPFVVFTFPALSGVPRLHTSYPSKLPKRCLAVPFLVSGYHAGMGYTQAPSPNPQLPGEVSLI